MKIELLNVRIFISKSTVVTDAIGNRRNEWQPFYTCYATVSGEAGKEQTDVGMVVDDSKLILRSAGAKRRLKLIVPISGWNSMGSFTTSPLWII